jgi:hypothetical protein
MSCDYLLTILLITSFSFSKVNNSYYKELCDNNHKFINFYLKTINKIRESGIESLAVLLTELQNKIPHKTANQNDWVLFSEQLATVLNTQRNIARQWYFTEQQIKLLGDYFSANSLLLDCLKLATVSNREAIKNSLFLPPSI